MTIIKKTYNIVIYDQAGTTILKTLKPDILKNELAFNSIKNGNTGQCILNLNFPFDNFYEGTLIEFNNIVRIYQNDKNTPPRLIYTGFISSYRPYTEGADEGVEVVLLGLGSLLSFFYYKSFGSTQFTKNDNVENLLTDIVDEFNSVYHNLISYDSDSIETGAAGVTINYTDVTMLEAINQSFSMAGAGDWWWSIDATGKLYFKKKPSTPTHIFTIGKDVERFEIDKSAENIVNSVTVDYTGGSVSASDPSSIAIFGERERINVTSPTTLPASAQKQADKIIEDNKDEKIKVNANINSLYDIETIKPGDTCKFRNFNKDSISLSNNMQIVSVTYTPKSCNLTLERIFGNFGVEITRFVNNEI